MLYISIIKLKVVHCRKINVLVKVLMKHHDKASRGGEGSLGLHYHTVVSGKEVRTGPHTGSTAEAGADMEAVKGSAYSLLSMTCSASFLTEPKATSPGMVSPTILWLRKYLSDLLS